MVRAHESASTRIFDALAAPMRLRILRLVYSQGPLSYSEIMDHMNLNPNRDAGKFAYHLRTLHNCGLLTTGKESKKYSITPLGLLMLDMSQKIDTESLREEGKLLVRTSRAAMEEFDRNKIIQALVREAGVPIEIAHRVAEETEARLLKLDTLYLTAPLIREFVNAVLIEKGLHEYRHKLTRLGLPVYDVSQLLKREASLTSIQDVHRTISRSVLAEYVLLSVLPRRVADAHLAGMLQVNDLDSWVLGPQTIQHDVRVFLRAGFPSSSADQISIALEPPSNLAEALTVLSSLVWDCSREIVEEQTLSHLNVFLAPFVREEPEILRNLLRQFIISINQTSNRSCRPATSFELDFTIPRCLRGVEAVGPQGKICGNYEDYAAEAENILETLIDLLYSDAEGKPIFSPQIILNLSAGDVESRNLQDLMMKVHSLAAERGTPIFINREPKWQGDAAYHSSGLRLPSTWSDDWELDCIRTGILGSVGINLPRIVYDSKGVESRIFSSIDEHLSMVVDALRAKTNVLNNLLGEGFLLCLSRNIAGEPYFRLENALFIVGLVGLNEATKVHTGKQIHESRSSMDFALRLLTYISTELGKLGASGCRVAVAHGCSEEAAQRFARLDVEKYGWGTVYAQGTRESPYYTDPTVSSIEAHLPLRDRVTIEASFHSLYSGGHILPVDLAEPKPALGSLLATTIDILRHSNLGAFMYNRTYGYCSNCHGVFGGKHQKCPQCNSLKTYITFSRFVTKYRSLSRLPKATVEALDRRHRYVFDKSTAQY